MSTNDSPPHAPVRGLLNPDGEDCWINSVLQMLYVLPELREEFTGDSLYSAGKQGSSLPPLTA